MSGRFEIVFLGTGSPLPSADRCGAGNVVVAGDTQVLVDCGWGAARRLRPSGVDPAQIGTAIFTHMHTDHMTDFPDLLFQRWTGGATRPLQVYGPDGTQEMVTGFLMALRRDIGFRIAHHGDKLHPDGIKVEVTELPVSASPARFLELAGLRCESFEVDHFPVVPAFGYRFGYDGRTAVLSGDTCLCPSLLEASSGTDMLVCEAMNVPMLQQRAAMLRAGGMVREAGLFEDIPSYHISTPEIAALARDAGVGELVLSHIIPPIGNDAAQTDAFMSGMSDLYKGSIRVASDMQRLPVVQQGGQMIEGDMLVGSLQARIRAMNTLWERAISDISLEQINHHERQGVLPIAFSFSHFMRAQDQTISRMFLGEAPLWEREGWAARVGVSVDAFGREESVAEMEQIGFADLDAFKQYQAQVLQRTAAAMATLTLARLAEVVVPQLPPNMQGIYCALVVGPGGPVRRLDALECFVYQHGLRHMGEVEHGRALVGLGGMTA